MKQKIWLYQIPLVLVACALYWVGERAIDGQLKNTWLRKHALPIVQWAEGSATDIKFNLRGARPPGNPVANVAIVEIDDSAIEQFGRWPWHRDETTKLIERTFESGAKVVGLDIVLAEKDIRVPDETRDDLVKLGVSSDQLRKYETDFRFSDLLDAEDPSGKTVNLGSRLVLGFLAEVCQPAYSSAEEPCRPAPWQTNSSTLNAKTSAERAGFLTFKDAFARFKLPAQGGLAPEQMHHSPLYTLKEDGKLTSNIEIYNERASSAGFLNPAQDNDGVIRRVPLINAIVDTVQGSLGLMVASLALSFDKKPVIKLSAAGEVESLTLPEQTQPVPVNRAGILELNFRGSRETPNPFPVIPAEYLLHDEKDPKTLADFEARHYSADEIKAFFAKAKEERARLKDKVVLIGVTAAGAFDSRTFPFGANQPGVIGHATTIDNLLNQDPLTRATDSSLRWLVLLMMSAGALFLAYWVERLSALVSVATFVLIIGVIGVLDVTYLFGQHRINLNTSLLAVELVLLFLFTTAAKYILEEKNKKFIKLAFSKYVAPSIVDSILKDPSKLTVGGEKKEVSILFSDIRGFTTFSENLDAKRLSTFLNEYLGVMTDLVFENDGTLDKYIGDAVMAFWGAPVDVPLHASQACKAAVAMQRVLAEKRPYFKETFGIDVEIGIGINTGTVSVGNMGSERIFEYTVIGDHVNLASRLEGLTKYYSVHIVTARFTLDEIEKSGIAPPPHRSLDLVKVKGKKNAIELIEILDVELSPDVLTAFATGRDLYRQRQWDDAIEAFTLANELSLKLKPEGDGPSQIFIERCLEFKKTPPDSDWEGSWEMTSK